MADDEEACYDGYLLAASKRGNVASMEEVLRDHRQEVNIDCQDGVGNTPLHYSANWGHFDTLKVMLDAGANPNVENFQKETALHRAFYKDNIPMIELLLTKGADPRKVNAQGLKPGDYAQSVRARNLRDLAEGVTKQKLVSMPPPVPDRRSKGKIELTSAGSSGPVDFSAMPSMKVDEKDQEED
eukprot:TRINITY_DN1180_c0_g1_i2.p1 TRINITY_DN1180_c0_g1~~TRINITY_DN1180_c0_g1_i2.p1  ORF type:complete len:184 (-),score=25.75 TRINITY_DN1180_c0_g1_i2:26-577(-)